MTSPATTDDAGRRRLVEVVVCAAPALVLAALVLVPFVEKAFTMDDTIFMLEARHALSDPLHPTAFSTSWKDAAARVSSFVPPGPLMAWLLTPAALAARPEVVAHVIQLLLMAIAIVATVSLAQSLGASREQSAIAGLLVAASPAVLGMAATAMPDVASMACAVFGMDRYLAWLRRGRARDAAFAAAALAAAPLARLHAITLLGVAFLLASTCAAGRHPVLARRVWLPLVAAAALVAAVLFAIRDPAPAGGGVAGATRELSSAGNIASNAVAFGVHWVTVLPLALPWIVLRANALGARWLMLPPAIGLAQLVIGVAHRGTAPWWLACIAGIGIFALADVVVDAWRRRDGLQLALAAWLFAAVPVLVYAHFPSKYLLPAVPAAALLAVRRSETFGLVRARAIFATCALAGVLLGVAVLRADAALAGAGRRAAAELIAPAAASGHRVWYLGHWGFQWYAEEAGARPLHASSRPDPGDLIVVPHHSEPGPLRGEARKHQEVGRLEVGGPGGRVMSHVAGAGFYSNAWGYLPWGRGNGPIEVFEVRVVSD